MKRVIVLIREDQILKWLLIGIFGPLGLLLLMVLSGFLGIKVPLLGDIFIYLVYIFFISLFSISIYLPFFKKTSVAKTNETKILIFLWLLISFITLISWSAISSFKLSLSSFDSIMLLLAPISAVLFLIGLLFLILNYFLGKSSAQKRQVLIFSIISAVIASLITAALIYQLKPLKRSIQVYPYEIHNGTSFGCSTKLGATLFPRPDYEDKVFKNVDGVLFDDDKTKMAIEIDGNELKMLTAGAIEIGITEPARLRIIKNNESELVAVDLEEDIAIDSGAGTFILNKKSGTAVWTKTKPAFIGSQLPDAQAYFMECR